jgi:anti-sigma factor RsiW
VSCERFEPLIGDLVDGTLDGAPRHALEAHLAGCASCSRLADELLVIRRVARTLPVMDPSAAVGLRVSAAVELERAARRPAPQWRRLLIPLAAAAVLVAGLAAAVVLRRGATAPAAPATATTRPAVDPATATSAELLGSVEAELQQAERHFESAVAGLEVLARDRQALDPQVASDLQKNLLVIDRAIGESRAALTVEPLNTQAQESLFDAFRSKIALLQDTIALINEVRKGNQAEVARIADSLNKS